MTYQVSGGNRMFGVMLPIDKVDRLIDERGLDQGELESLVGLSHGRISKWKKGTGEISAAQALRIARVLGVCVEWLIDPDADWPPAAPGRPTLSDDQRFSLTLINDLELSRADVVKLLAGRTLPKPGRKPGNHSSAQ